MWTHDPIELKAKKDPNFRSFNKYAHAAVVVVGVCCHWFDDTMLRIVRLMTHHTKLDVDLLKMVLNAYPMVTTKFTLLLKVCGIVCCNEMHMMLIRFCCTS